MLELWRLRRELGKDLASRRLLYLDQRFWNAFCDVKLGATPEPHAEDALLLLREAVAGERVLCPIESHVFLELYKQRIETKRRATAAIIDDLSRGVVILAPLERVFLEVLRFVQFLKNDESGLMAPRDEVWTKAAFILGHITPHDPSIPPDLAKTIEDQYHNDLWQRGFSDICADLGDPPDPEMVWTVEAAKRLNRGKRDARTKFKSYEALYDSELDGVLEAYADSLADVSLHLFTAEGHDGSTVSDAQKQDAAKGLRSVLGKAFRKRSLLHALPTLHITATLFARMQWDAARDYSRNDFADFGHATAAFGYYDAFATEGPLADLSRQANLPAVYGTAVLTSFGQLRDWLRQELSGALTAV